MSLDLLTPGPGGWDIIRQIVAALIGLGGLWLLCHFTKPHDKGDRQ